MTSPWAAQELGKARRAELEARATRSRAAAVAVARSDAPGPAEHQERTARPHWWPRAGLRWRVS
jgi:hypothetical protein